MFFWGRVVDEGMAKLIPRHLILPLGDAEGMGPALFVEGTASSNARRDDCCIAWLIASQKAKASGEPLAKKSKMAPE
eukprot:5364445-Heterocapsa_arctica.AAC.1